MDKSTTFSTEFQGNITWLREVLRTWPVVRPSHQKRLVGSLATK
jgi:hypothetical protein